MHKAIFPIAAAAALALAGIAHAQAPDFATIDADASGELSVEEITAVGIQVTEDQFAAADADTSGGLSEAEFMAATTAQ